MMSYHKYSILVLLSLFTLLGVNGQSFHFTKPLQDAYFKIQSLQIEGSNTVIKHEQETRNGFVPYLESYSDFFYFLVTDDVTLYPAFEKKQSTRISTLESLETTSPYKRMLLAEMRLHSAFLKFKLGNRVSGCWDVIKADRLLQENKKQYPNFVPQLKTIGLLKVLVGSVPEDYSWIIKLLGLKGNINEGLADLNKVGREQSPFSVESNVVALLLRAYILKSDTQVVNQLANLASNHPDNLLYSFLASSLLIKNGRSDEAFDVLSNAPAGSKYLPFPILTYLKAEIYLQRGQYDLAFKSYDLFLAQTRGVNFIKDSYFKQFLCNWLQNKPVGNWYEIVSKVGAENAEADNYAQKMANSYAKGELKEEQKILFVARYTSDGGYLKAALEKLSTKTEGDFQELSNRAEFNYRKGRIWQQQNETKSAIPYFVRTIQLSENLNVYYGPSAALQLGYIYKEQRKMIDAKRYFEKAIAFKKHPYKGSIDNKAKAALNEMKSLEK